MKGLSLDKVIKSTYHLNKKKLFKPRKQLNILANFYLVVMYCSLVPPLSIVFPMSYPDLSGYINLRNVEQSVHCVLAFNKLRWRRSYYILWHKMPNLLYRPKKEKKKSFTCHLSPTSTATANGPPSPNSPTMHSKLVCQERHFDLLDPAYLPKNPFSPTRPRWAELVIESPCPSVCHTNHLQSVT